MGRKKQMEEDIHICLRCRCSHSENTTYCEHCSAYRRDRDRRIKAGDALYRAELRKYLRLDNEEIT